MASSCKTKFALFLHILPCDRPMPKRTKVQIHVLLILLKPFYSLYPQFLTKKLGADPVVFGQLQTAFAIAQLAGGPIYGRLGDLMGERVALVLAFASATASYAIMGLATSIEMLFLSRAFSVLLHVMQGKIFKYVQ